MKIPVLGIPTYNRTDLLLRCVRSIDYAVEKLVIIDNDQGDLVGLVRAHLSDCVGELVQISQPNAGVAASWNQIIKSFSATWWMIANDDIEFSPGDLEKMAAFVEKEVNTTDSCQVPGIVYGNHGASWFSITEFGVNVVGLFDENIFPAYLEDCDWSYRADLLGVRRCDVPDVKAIHGDDKHTGSCTVNSDPELAVSNSRTHGGNFDYYRRKWGGLNGTELFKTPFVDPRWPVWAWKFETATRARQQW